MVKFGFIICIDLVNSQLLMDYADLKSELFLKILFVH